MSDLDKKFSGSIPEIYDTYLVPLIMIGVGTYILLDTATDTLR